MNIPSLFELPGAAVTVIKDNLVACLIAHVCIGYFIAYKSIHLWSTNKQERHRHGKFFALFLFPAAYFIHFWDSHTGHLNRRLRPSLKYRNILGFINLRQWEELAFYYFLNMSIWELRLVGNVFTALLGYSAHKFYGRYRDPISVKIAKFGKLPQTGDTAKA
jgi:hypothetical protein